MDIGKLQPRSSVLPRSRELHALDRTWVIWRVVDDGKVIEEVVLGIYSVASVKFDIGWWLIPKTGEDAAETLCSRKEGTVWRVISRRSCFSDN